MFVFFFFKAEAGIRILVGSRGPGVLYKRKLFNRLYVLLDRDGILTTYCAKGVVRRMLQTAGFTVERLPGPPGGKREILRARK